jgi:hypothetical protein
MEKTMKWYDYAICIGCADIISTGVVHFDIIEITAGWVAYFIWETIREIEKEGGF